MKNKIADTVYLVAMNLAKINRPAANAVAKLARRIRGI